MILNHLVLQSLINQVANSTPQYEKPYRPSFQSRSDPKEFRKSGTIDVIGGANSRRHEEALPPVRKAGRERPHFEVMICFSERRTFSIFESISHSRKRSHGFSYNFPDDAAVERHAIPTGFASRLRSSWRYAAAASSWHAAAPCDSATTPTV